MFIVSNLEEYRRSNLADRQKDDDDNDGDDDDDDEGEARPGSQTRRRRRLGTARPPSSTHQPCESAGLARPLGGGEGQRGDQGGHRGAPGGAGGTRGLRPLDTAGDPRLEAFPPWLLLTLRDKYTPLLAADLLRWCVGAVEKIINYGYSGRL